MRENTNAFTFVELIIVLVILAILSTIGFVVYESYLSTGRDTKRIVELKNLHQSLGSFAIKNKLPFPTEKIDITSSGTLISYHGNIDDSIGKTINFKGNLYDTEFDAYPVYVLGKNRKDFQLLNFVEDRSSLLKSNISSSYAFTDYQILVPTVIGKPLGVFLGQESKKPIHILNFYKNEVAYDIVSGTGIFDIHISNNKVIDTSQTGAILQIIPNLSCRKILENGKSRGSGRYQISPDGRGLVTTYCDMQTNGGGWTLIGRGREGWTWDDNGNNVGQVGSFIGTKYAFDPAYYSAEMVNNIIEGKNLSQITDGVLLKRSLDVNGKKQQNIIWEFSDTRNWTWNFETPLVLSDTIIDGESTGGGNTKDDYNGGYNGEKRIFTWGWGGHAGKKGFSYGVLVNAGTNSPDNFLWENTTEGHAIPYTEVYIK